MTIPAGAFKECAAAERKHMGKLSRFDSRANALVEMRKEIIKLREDFDNLSLPFPFRVR